LHCSLNRARTPQQTSSCAASLPDAAEQDKDRFTLSPIVMKPRSSHAIPLLAHAFSASVAAFLVCAALPAEAQQKKQPEKKGPAATTTPAATPAGAQTFLIGTFGDWKALMTGKDKQKVCYALSQPKERLPAKLARDPGYLFISNRAADGAKNEIAFKLGFSTKAGQDGSLAIGSGNFSLVGSGESAFLKNPAQEAQLIELMKKSSGITLKMSSLRGNETTDKYSLNGFGKALEAVAKECP
jgi:invasion protein IalB